MNETSLCGAQPPQSYLHTPKDQIQGAGQLVVVGPPEFRDLDRTKRPAEVSLLGKPVFLTPELWAPKRQGWLGVSRANYTDLFQPPSLKSWTVFLVSWALLL